MMTMIRTFYLEFCLQPLLEVWSIDLTTPTANSKDMSSVTDSPRERTPGTCPFYSMS